MRAAATRPARKELVPGLFGGNSGKQEAAPQPTASEAQAAEQAPAQAEETELGANAVPQAVQDVTGEQAGSHVLLVVLLALAGLAAAGSLLLARRKKN